MTAINSFGRQVVVLAPMSLSVGSRGCAALSTKLTWADLPGCRTLLAGVVSTKTFGYTFWANIATISLPLCASLTCIAATKKPSFAFATGDVALDTIFKLKDVLFGVLLSHLFGVMIVAFVAGVLRVGLRMAGLARNWTFSAVVQQKGVPRQ